MLQRLDRHRPQARLPLQILKCHSLCLESPSPNQQHSVLWWVFIFRNIRSSKLENAHKNSKRSQHSLDEFLKETHIIQCWPKKKWHTKIVIFGSKILFCPYEFFLDYLKTVICELMLLKLGNLLGLSLLRNFFSVVRFW